MEGVDLLWRQLFPDDPPRNRANASIPQKLACDDLIFVAEDQDGSVVGSIMAGYDGHRGWLYAVAVDQQVQRAGIGSKLVGEAVEQLKALGCTKVNLQIRAGNEAVAEFYAKLDFVEEARISMGRAL